MKFILRLIPTLLIEIISRCSGYTISLFKPEYGYPLERKTRGLYWSLYMRSKQLSVGRNVQFEGLDNIKLCDRVRINDGTQIIAGTRGRISIGKDSHIARNAVIAGAGDIKIGARCMISSCVAIYTVTNQKGFKGAAFAPPLRSPVFIGDDVFIGVSATILPGVRIGDRAVIAAGALVNKDVDSDSTVIGVPARVLMG